MALLASDVADVLAVSLDFIATLGALIVATFALHATRDQAKEARRAADEAVRATSIANRPLLVPYTDENWPAPRVASSQDMRQGKVVDVRRVSVRVKNVGRGPALLDAARFTHSPDHAAPLQGVMSIGPGEAVTLQAEFVLDQGRDDAERLADRCEITIDYDDIFEAPGPTTLHATFTSETGWRTDRRPGVPAT